MQDLRELSNDDRVAYLYSLNVSHRIRVEVSFYDSDENFVETISPRDVPLLSGQVDVDAEADISRQVSLDFALGPNRKRKPLSVFGKEDAMFHPASFLEVCYLVYVEGLEGGADWVCVPVFYGPTTVVQTSGDTIHIEAQSKEVLFIPPSSPRASLDFNPDKMSIRALIRAIATAHGESRFRLGTGDIPTVAVDTAKLYRWKKESGLWKYMQAIARGAGHQLFYSADGYLTLRKLRGPWTTPAYTFNVGNSPVATIKSNGTVLKTGGNMLSSPSTVNDMSTFRNRVVVTGPAPKGSGRKVSKGEARLPKAYPLDANELEWGGVARDLVEYVETDVVQSNAAARITAQKLLNQYYGYIDPSFEALPVPHLEPNDVIHIGTGLSWPLEEYGTWVRSFTLPLVPGEPMSVGFNKRVRFVQKTR